MSFAKAAERKDSNFTASRVAGLTESKTVEVARAAVKYQAIDLALGTPDEPVIEEIKEAAVRAIRGGVNHYADSRGAELLREAIAQKTERHLNVKVNPETEITVTCGSTEAIINALMAIVDPGDEVIVFEPFYKNHAQDVILCGGIPRYVRLHPPKWYLDEQELTCTFSSRTKAVILNNPSNPTGKVFSRNEIEIISRLCQKWDVICVTDEIYDHLIFDGLKHISPIQIDGMRERSIVVSGMSKTYGITGWRIGYVVAPPMLTKALRAVHYCTTAGAAAPLQTAAVVPLQMSETYYRNLCRDYQSRRDRVINLLESLGFVCYSSQGGYYIMADISRFGFKDDVNFTQFLIENIGVAVVPGSGFYSGESNVKNLVRFCFAKSDNTLKNAEERLAKLARFD